MSVWLTIPSARADAGTVPLWHKRGYKIALWRDTLSPGTYYIPANYNNFYNLTFPDGDGPFGCTKLLVGPYPGYAKAVNELVREVLAYDDTATWCIATGDDTEPDLAYSPSEIDSQLQAHFGDLHHRGCQRTTSTLGVMQPTGDRWGDEPHSRTQYGPDRGAFIDRICGSPWMGREFCERAYGGRGPLWEEFSHMHVDEHLMCVAEKLGILWQRRDLIHLHHHFTRVGDAVNWTKGRNEMPEFLREANTPEHWARSSAIFNRLKAGGFAEAYDLLP